MKPGHPREDGTEASEGGGMSPFDDGALSPATAGHASEASDAAVVEALVAAERALITAYGAVGAAPRGVVDAARGLPVPEVRPIALAAVSGGNPVIPLAAQLRAEAPAALRDWIHRGATSQDILDTALMMVSKAAVAKIADALAAAEAALARLAAEHRDTTAVARTLTQHAVPTTIGLRAANWLSGVRRARARLGALTFPAQLGGAGGTLASFVEILGAVDAERLPAAFADAAGLDAPDGVWHVVRWPVTELGDALVQVADAAGAVAADAATLSRTEIAELSEGAGGGSSAMPQKRNPAHAVLIRSAAMRAPNLAATLHQASALAVDERPDGAWHAEWPALRELLRTVLGASAHLAELAAGLRVDVGAVARNLALTGGLVVSERLSIAFGREAAHRIVAEAAAGEDLDDLVREARGSTGDSRELLDPAQYTGLAGRLVDRALAASPEEDA